MYHEATPGFGSQEKSGLRLEVGRSSSSSSLFSLVGEMARVSRLDPPVSLRTSGVEGTAGDAAGGGEAGGAPAWCRAAH